MKTTTTWVRRWKMTISSEPILPGVWRRKEGGFVVCGAAKDPKTGKLKDVRKVLANETDPKNALAWLTNERDKIRRGAEKQAKREIPTWKTFAKSLFDTKLADGSIQSAKGQEKWMTCLSHLFKAPWADYLVDKIRHADLVDWRNTLPSLRWVKQGNEHEAARARKLSAEGMSARRIAEVLGCSHPKVLDLLKGKTKGARSGPYMASTLNDWLGVARGVFAAATIKYDLPRDPMVGIDDFVVTTRTYTEEEPNALTPEEVGIWLAKFLELYPQFYAMAFLGLVHGQRVSALRPLRRQGPTPDIILDKNPRMLIRQSHTLGQEAWDQTKTKVDNKITLHEEVIEVIKWHIQTQLETDAQRRSELLFPNAKGGYRSRSCLDKPFAAVTAACNFGKRITPRALRRTFQDLSRAAGVEGIVAKAISGHATDAMRVRYSTAQNAEVAAAVGNIIDLAKVRERKVAG